MPDATNTTKVQGNDKYEHVIFVALIMAAVLEINGEKNNALK